MAGEEETPLEPTPSLVVDANILLRAVLGVRVRKLIVRYSERVALFTPALCLRDAHTYLPRIAKQRGWDPKPPLELLQALSARIQVVNASLYERFEEQARRRIAGRDEQDWPVIALALALQCPVWTEDADFFGSGVATWTTRTVELYLRRDS